MIKKICLIAALSVTVIAAEIEEYEEGSDTDTQVEMCQKAIQKTDCEGLK